MNRKFYILFLLLTLFSIAALNAATITFTGGGDGTSWEDPANWDTGTVPGFGDQALIGGANIVSLTGFAAINSLRVFDNASFTILSTAVLTINEQDPVGDAAQIYGDAEVQVYGSLVILNSPGNGIELFESGELLNMGFVNIIDSGSEGIFMYDFSDIYNLGIMFIQGGDDDGLDMENGAGFYNDGTLNIDNYASEGIDMDDEPEFINNGTLNITNGDASDAIDIDDDDTYFENNGALNISVVINRGEGIEVDDGEFQNNSSGTVNISGVTGDGIYIEDDGTFDNQGIVSVSITPGESSDNAVELACGAFLNNTNIINIWVNGSSDAIELECSTSEIENEDCGVINIITNNKIDIQSTGLFFNDGVIATVFNGTNTNFGTLDNDGRINAPNGFLISPNALTGTGSVNMNGAVPAQSDCNINFGTIGCGGEAEYNSAQDSYSLYSENCFYAQSYTSDEISYIFQELCGNGEIIARVASFNGEGWGGVMMREDLTAGSRKISLMLNQSQVARREARVSPNGPAFPQQFPAYGYSWVRLVRNGNYFMGFISQNGINWQFVMNQYIPMTNCIHIGLVATNYNQFNSSANVEFHNVFFSSAPLATPDVRGDLDIAYEAVTQESISVYPNPTSGKITIDVNSSRDEVVDIRVINSLGQSVKSLSLNPFETFRKEVDLSGLPAGMYYVHFQKANGETQVERVILNAIN